MKTFILLTDAFGAEGGIAKFNRDLLEALCRYPGMEEVVAIPRLQPKPFGKLPGKLTYVKSGLGSKLKYLLYVLSLFFKRTRNKNIYSFIVCGHINLLPIACLLGRHYHTAVLLIIHGVEAWKPSRAWLIKRFVNKVSAVISVSRETRERFLMWSGYEFSRVTVLPNCIHPDEFGVGPKNERLVKQYRLQGKTVMMTLSRIAACERYKGLDEVLELMPVLLQDIPNLHYLIAGDGDDRGRLEAKTAKIGLQDCVTFTGFVPEEEKAEHLRLADAFVMPGRGEGFGIVYLEAMACGLPVVGSRLDGSREALRDGKLGILTNPDDPEELKSAILEAVKRPKGVVPKGLDYFSFDLFEQRLTDIVNRILEQKQRPH